VKPRLTDWIPGEVKPTMPGVYQKQIFGDEVYAHWNGKFWGMYTGVFHQPKDALEYANSRSISQHTPWRGLAEDPSAAKAASQDTNGD
jgi:hypothetical protein